MNRKIIVTGDNSKSLLIPDLDETYHSVHGARNESQHIFINCGLLPQLSNSEVRIFEMGFGTGLNALLTLHAAQSHSTPIIYDTFEKYPVDLSTILEIGHPENTGLAHLAEAFTAMHTCEWDTFTQITPGFMFRKSKGDIKNAHLKASQYTLIYYDAFAPKIQPDLWTDEIMQKMYDALQPGGTLLTYCAQGQFRRNLKAAGFSIERLGGPAGKREITRATR
ncbi:MAG: tRNA (5-methylaminomethyl-2-thiouridine)(34)-methyltransferase MnmD [Bacteroidetes bacterium]|nr:tRNA (5-methylaminomethyl-2-thiouridine)(34)-methyltransferase MnmD [Bacteroidota bacterium]